MLISLQTKNKLGFINGSCPRPALAQPTLHPWERCNAIVLSWIMNSVSKEILSGIIYCTDASNVWVDLKEMFDKICGSRIFSIHRDIAHLTQGSSSISVYFSNLKRLWDEFNSLVTLPFCECASAKAYAEHEQQQHILQFLMGLNDSYGHIRNQVLMMDPLPSVNQAYSFISHEESNRRVLSSQPVIDIPTAAFYSSSTKKSDPIRCEHCTIPCHTKENCFRLVGYPPGHKLHKRFPQVKGSKHNHQPSKIAAQSSFENRVPQTTSHEEPRVSNVLPRQFTDAQYQQILQLLDHNSIPTHEVSANLAGTFTSLMTINDTNSWILESGANAHITGSSGGIKNSQPCDSATGSMRLPNGNTTQILSSGSVQISPSCVLHRVLHVPEFNFNILSISQFTKDHQCSISFYLHFCLFRDLLTGRIMGIGKQNHGLYYLHRISSAVVPSSSTKASSRPVFSSLHTCNLSHCKDLDVDIWHKRFGHLSLSPLQFLPFIRQKSLTHHCTICPISKQTRTVFPTTYRSSSPHAFHLLHIDIWGLYRTPTHNGFKYFLTVVDDFSRNTWVFLMHFKSDTLQILKQFFEFILNHFNISVKHIRTYNGYEFFSTECNTYFSSMGIIHQS